MKYFVLTFCIVASSLVAKAQAQTTTYYQYSVWKGKNHVAYVTSVYSFDIPDYRITANYYNEIKGKFLRSLEIDGVGDWNDYYFVEMPDSKNKSELEEKRLNYIARLKRDGYTVKTSYFSWKLKE
ncbi:hypothetical protein A9P82_00490 [Arachidicoccus ginsenosidimutans]|uniref:hypothetical protein n=1 Tax=Arachidicoccus sp. BS20 TaxID=1850526 RepID=UPI0007F0ECF0|nr:hypothetical protein [Arachidicoccus sp. BS20]ANI87926.1 hypothetical protein A9P82_00490 [Arachidicoccus sp. BS20]